MAEQPGGSPALPPTPTHTYLSGEVSEGKQLPAEETLEECFSFACTSQIPRDKVAQWLPGAGRMRSYLLVWDNDRVVEVDSGDVSARM